MLDGIPPDSMPAPPGPPEPLPAFVHRVDGRWRLVFVPRVGRHLLRHAAVAFVLPFGAALPVLLIVSGVARFAAGSATRWRITLVIVAVLAVIGLVLVVLALLRQLRMARWADLPGGDDPATVDIRRVAGRDLITVADLRRVVVTGQPRLGGQTGVRVRFETTQTMVTGALVTYRTGVDPALAGWLTEHFATSGVEIQHEPVDDRPGVLRFL